jgi:hypothetical protein
VTPLRGSIVDDRELSEGARRTAQNSRDLLGVEMTRETATLGRLTGRRNAILRDFAGARLAATVVRWRVIFSGPRPALPDERSGGRACPGRSPEGMSTGIVLDTLDGSVHGDAEGLR